MLFEENDGGYERKKKSDDQKKALGEGLSGSHLVVIGWLPPFSASV
jgi:hypothetical protein